MAIVNHHSHAKGSGWCMRCRCSINQRERTISPRVSIYNRDMHDVVVYSRQGCHLCDVVKETLRKLQDEADYRWREVDIDADRELQQKYNDEVPVVLINGRKAFKYHMSARDFLRVLAEDSSQCFLAVLRTGPTRIIWGTYHLSPVFRSPIPSGNPISEQLSAGSVTESVPLKCACGNLVYLSLQHFGRVISNVHGGNRRQITLGTFPTKMTISI